MRYFAAVTISSLLASSLLAQEPVRPELPRWRIELGLAGGQLEHLTESSNLDGDADAGMFRVGLEAFGKSGLGGGIRYEAWASDDNLFASAPAVEAQTGSLFAHLSYRFGEQDFLMPLRGGLLLHNHRLDPGSSVDEIDFATAGMLIEVSPEFILTRTESVRWSLYGTLGLGTGFTTIESDALASDFDSTTNFFGVDIGTRVAFGAFEVGLSYVLRRHEMDRSDPENSLVVFGYDSTFDGIMLTLGAVF